MQQQLAGVKLVACTSLAALSAHLSASTAARADLAAQQAASHAATETLQARVDVGTAANVALQGRLDGALLQQEARQGEAAAELAAVEAVLRAMLPLSSADELVDDAQSVLRPGWWPDLKPHAQPQQLLSVPHHDLLQLRMRWCVVHMSKGVCQHQIH